MELYLFFFHIWLNLDAKIPAGIFLPTIGIGACLGRAVGLIMYVINPSLCIYVYILIKKVLNRQSLYRAYPTAWIFLACPPDPSVRCISPGFYAVIGASAMLAGVTRMTSVLVNCLSTSAFFWLIYVHLKFFQYPWWLFCLR